MTDRGRIPVAVPIIREELDTARKRVDALTREYAVAYAAAIERSRPPANPRAVYKEQAVLVRLNSDEAMLRQQLQQATVAVNDAERRLREAWVRSGFKG